MLSLIKYLTASVTTLAIFYVLFLSLYFKSQRKFAAKLEGPNGLPFIGVFHKCFGKTIDGKNNFFEVVPG